MTSVAAINIAAGHARSGSVHTPDPDKILSSDALLLLARERQRQNSTNVLRTIGTYAAWLLFAYQEGSSENAKPKSLKAALAKALDNVNDIKLVSRSTREHVALADAVAQRLDANGHGMNRYRTAREAADKLGEMLASKYRSVDAMREAFGKPKKNGQKKDPAKLAARAIIECEDSAAFDRLAYLLAAIACYRSGDGIGIGDTLIDQIRAAAERYAEVRARVQAAEEAADDLDQRETLADAVAAMLAGSSANDLFGEQGPAIE